MKKIYVLRGVPGCGKSTFIRHHHLEPYTISTDNLRLLYGNLKYIYDEKQGKTRQVIPQEYNEQTFNLLYSLIDNKMQRGETIFVDATHLYPNAFEAYREYVEKYHYEMICIDFTKEINLNELLKRNLTRVDFRWVDPEVIKKIYKFAKSHPRLPRWVHQVTPNQFANTLYIGEIDLSTYRSIAIIGEEANFKGTLKPHEFYISYNHDFARKHHHSKDVIFINRDLSTCRDHNAYTIFPFIFKGKHYLATSRTLRDEFIGYIKNIHGRNFYNFGLANLTDFMQEFPVNASRVKQISLNNFKQSSINRLA